MAGSRGSTPNDYYDGMTFHNLDQIQPRVRTLSPIRLTSQHEEYQDSPRRNYDKQQTHQSEKSKCCSKQCLIGLCIGLLIGIALVIAIAVPIGVTRTCPTSIEATTSVTTSCPSTTTSSPRSCIGVISSTPNWTGTFLMDDGCLATASCCCLLNQIIVNQTITNGLQITGNVTGQCTNMGPTAVIIFPTIPTTFQTGFFWGPTTVRLQLGRDNSYLSFVNTANPYCSGTALRRS